MRFRHQQNTSPNQNAASTVYQNSHIDSDMKNDPRQCIVRFMFIHVGEKIYECRLDLNNVLTELQNSGNAKITIEAFQDRCLELVTSILVDDYEVSVQLEDLELYELDGQPIKSILDWLQKPTDSNLIVNIALVVQKDTDITEAVKYFEHNRPISLSGSEVAQKPVQEVLALFNETSSHKENNRNTVYANQSFAGLQKEVNVTCQSPELVIQGKKSKLQTKHGSQNLD